MDNSMSIGACMWTTLVSVCVDISFGVFMDNISVGVCMDNIQMLVCVWRILA